MLKETRESDIVIAGRCVHSFFVTARISGKGVDIECMVGVEVL